MSQNINFILGTMFLAILWGCVFYCLKTKTDLSGVMQIMGMLVGIFMLLAIQILPQSTSVGKIYGCVYVFLILLLAVVIFYAIYRGSVEEKNFIFKVQQMKGIK